VPQPQFRIWFIEVRGFKHQWYSEFENESEQLLFGLTIMVAFE